MFDETVYRLRAARAEDIARLADIERAAATLFIASLDQLGLTPDAISRTTPDRELARAQEAGRLWVADTDAGLLVGFALVVDVGGFAHLDELDVLPEHGRRGVGMALLSAVAGWAVDHGYEAVTLRTFRDVPWNAPFYQRRGFEIVESASLSPEHVALETLEQQRGLRIDVRVTMIRRLR